MPKAKGSEKFGGRKKGTKNLVPTAVREMVLRTLNEMNEEAGGGVGYLKLMAKDEPKSFATLISKCIPQAVEGNLTVDHTFNIRDFTTTGEINGGEENDTETPEVIEVESVRIEAGAEAGSQTGTETPTSSIPIEAIDRGSIPVAVSRQSER